MPIIATLKVYTPEKLEKWADTLFEKEWEIKRQLVKDGKLDKRAPCDYNVLLSLGRRMRNGHPVKHIVMLRAMELQWPGYLYLKKDGIENDFFQRQIKGLCAHKFLNMMGCGSSGKTFGFAAYGYTYWKMHPGACSVFISTTSAQASEMRAWGVITELHERDVYGKKIKWGIQLDYKKTIVLQGDPNDKSDRDYRDSISVVLIKPGNEGKNAIGSICGRKNSNVIWCCDEQPFMPAGIRDARGNLYSNPFAQFIGIGNEPEEGDPLYLDAEPHGEGFEQGWDTPGLVDMEEWPTQRGVCLYFDGEKSPNLKAEEGKPPPFPRLATREFINLNIAEDGGTPDGPNYWRWVKGFPKRGSKQNTVLTQEVLKEFGASEDPVWREKPFLSVAGLDLGFREDGDPCVADFGRVGYLLDGGMVLAHEKDTVKLMPKLSEPGSFEQKIAKAFLDQCEKRQCHVVAADVSGDGGLMIREIEIEARKRGYTLEMYPISSLGSADDRIRYEIGGKFKTGVEMFDRRVSQIVYSYRLAVQDRLIKGCHPDSNAAKQLCQRRVKQDANRRYVIETKKEMKKRIKRSPDDGDARVYCYEAARLKGLQKTRVNPTPELPKELQPKKGAAYASRTTGRAYAKR